MVGFDDEESSFVDFGTPDPTRVQTGEINDDTVVTFGMNDDFFWSTYIQAVKFDENL
jgi:hypothetical protein